MLTVIIFIVVLSVLVFVHELGHFWVAKRFGMRVEEFGFGFPPRIFGVKRGETIYSINWIPFGGFVRIFGEDGSQASDPKSFAAARPGSRSKVIVAGVAMNILLALVLLIVGNIIGLRVGLTSDELKTQAQDVKIQIIQVAEASPARGAGLKMLDEIVGGRLGGQSLSFKELSEVQGFINDNRGREIVLEIRNGSEISGVRLTPRLDPPPGQGAIGITLAMTGVVKYPWYQALYRGVENTAFITQETVIGYATIIKNLFVTGKAGAELSGPVGVAVITGQAARLGFNYLIQLVALISVNLAVLNIIPFPALDGGRLLFVGIEKLKGSPVSRRVEATINAAGFAILVMLMIYVTSRDVVRFF